MDEEMPTETLDMLEEQARRFQGEARLLFALRDLERGGLQLHDPGELINTAVELFQRLPESSNVRIEREQAADVVAVEVIAGACVRALVLCLRTIAETVVAGETATALVRVEQETDRVAVHVLRRGMELNAESPTIMAAAEMLAEPTGARLDAGPHVTVRMRMA